MQVRGIEPKPGWMASSNADGFLKTALMHKWASRKKVYGQTCRFSFSIMHLGGGREDREEEDRNPHDVGESPACLHIRKKRIE
mmetsp:Transcript_29638/g.58164  ORF Transcript_29638/g.58164 Transcript_29638/m.58164 type:complete len:83 (+) Transcript_29638:2950-3198(+)